MTEHDHQLELAWIELRAVVAEELAATADGIHREASFIHALGAGSLDRIQISTVEYRS
jgi:acyl carrier protein